jgi:hypothetical protein
MNQLPGRGMMHQIEETIEKIQGLSIKKGEATLPEYRRTGPL